MACFGSILRNSYSHSGGQWRPDSYIAWRPNPAEAAHARGMRLPSTTSLRPAKSLLMIPALVVSGDAG